MASVDRIDSLVDKAAIAGEFAFLETEIKKAVEAIKAAKAQTIGFNVDTKSIADFNKNIGSLNTSLQNVQKSVNGVTTATTAAAKAADAESNSLTKNIELRRRLQNTLDSYNKDQKDDLALLKAGTISRAEYNKRLTEAQVKSEQYKVKIQQLNKEIKEEIKNQGAASSAYKEFARQVKAAQEQAQNYAVALGKTHPQTIQAAANAKRLSDELKAIDASVGINVRNVGNYSSAFSRFGKTLNGVLTPFRTLAYILPGIGISGIFLAIATGISSVAKAALNMGNTLSQTEKETKAYAAALDEVRKAAISSAAPDVTKLQLYRDILNDTTRSTEERTQALNAYNKIADEGNKIDVSQLNNLNLINDKISEQISLIEKRTLSRAAENILADKAEKLLLAQQTARNNAEKSYQADLEAGQILQTKYYDPITKSYREYSETALKLDQERIISNRTARDETVKNAKLEFDQAKKALYSLIQLEGFAAEEIKTTKAKKAKEGRDLDEVNRKAAFEILKADLELEKELQLSRAGNEKLSYTQRTAELINYGLASRALIEAQAEFELGTAELTRKEREKIENDKVNAIIRANEELRDRLEKILSGSFKVNTEKAAEQVKGITGAYAKIYADLKKQTEQAGKDLIERQKKIKDAIYRLAKEVSGLFVDLFQNDIERQKNAVQEQIDLLEQQKQKDIELANQTITNAQDRADAIAVIEARAAAQRQQLELRQRQLDQQKARWEKAENVASIIQNTARAVAEALPNIPLSILVGAIGAAQLVRALAAPIPKYAEGTENHPGGLAIVGDGGRPEGVQLPDGTIYKTPAVDTVVDLPAGTKVYADYYKMPMNEKQKVIDNTDTLKAVGRDIVRAVKNIPQPIYNGENNWTKSMRRGSTFRHYLNKNL